MNDYNKICKELKTEAIKIFDELKKDDNIVVTKGEISMDNCLEPVKKIEIKHKIKDIEVYVKYPANLFMCLILMLFLILPANATTYKTYNNKIYSSSGESYKTYGNKTISSNGTTYKQYGNRVQSSNGNSYKQYGNTVYKNDGTRYKIEGNRVTGTDGTRCKTYNNKTYCN